MKNSKVRGIISTILILSALVSISTGLILYFLPYGMWFCFTRKFLNDTHLVSGLIMGLAIIVHFILNQHIYRMELTALWSRNKH